MPCSVCFSVYCTLQQCRPLSAVPRDSAACMGAIWSGTLRHVRGRDDRKSWNSKRPSEQRGLIIIICRERRSVRGKRILQRGHRHAAKAKRYQKYLISCLHGSLPPSLPPSLFVWMLRLHTRSIFQRGSYCNKDSADGSVTQHSEANKRNLWEKSMPFNETHRQRGARKLTVGRVGSPFTTAGRRGFLTSGLWVDELSTNDNYYTTTTTTCISIACLYILICDSRVYGPSVQHSPVQDTLTAPNVLQCLYGLFCFLFFYQTGCEHVPARRGNSSIDWSMFNRGNVDWWGNGRHTTGVGKFRKEGGNRWGRLTWLVEGGRGSDVSWSLYLRQTWCCVPTIRQQALFDKRDSNWTI